MNEVVKPWGEPISPRDSIRMLMQERGVTYKRLAELVGYAGTSSVQMILSRNERMLLNKYMRFLRVLDGKMFIAYKKNDEMNYADIAVRNVPEILLDARNEANVSYKNICDKYGYSLGGVGELLTGKNPTIKSLCFIVEAVNGRVIFRDYLGNDYPIKVE